MIFDSHAHYDDKAFDEDRKELLDSMKDGGVGYIVNIGADIESSQKTIELTKEYPFLYGAVGVHPEEAAVLTEDKLEWIKEQCKNKKIVALGEIGLDYYWKEPAKEIQQHWFRRQLQTAKEINIPIIIHSRDAAKDTLTIMREENAEELEGVIHCFSYTKETARDFLEMDYYFGIGGVITFQNAKKLKEAVEYIPLEKILLETDCPYLAPIPYRGKRNNSLHLKFVAEEIAKIKGVSYETVLEITEKNGKDFYKIG